MNNDRELMQEALDALTYVGDKDIYSGTIDALRARLAQPENDFNPDWDAMAVMVEEQQRMAKRIEELETRLAQPEPEPVADKYLMEVECTKCGAKQDGVLTVTAPQQRNWQGLTDEEISELIRNTHNTGSFVRAIEAKLKEKNA